MNYTDYMIIAKDSVGELVDEVRTVMGFGWQPLGGPFQLPDPLLPYPSYCQAMGKVSPEGGAAVWRELDRLHNLQLDVRP